MSASPIDALDLLKIIATQHKALVVIVNNRQSFESVEVKKPVNPTAPMIMSPAKACMSGWNPKAPNPKESGRIVVVLASKPNPVSA